MANTIFEAWKGHRWTFVFWLVLSMAAILLIPFSDSLSSGESFFFATGAWMGFVACVLYFLPIPLKYRPVRIKRLATWILVFSVFAFVTDFPIFAGILWSMKNSEDDVGSESDDNVLMAAAGVLFLHGCFAIVAFAKCMIMGTYEIPPGEARFY